MSLYQTLTICQISDQTFDAGYEWFNNMVKLKDNDKDKDKSGNDNENTLDAGYE